MMILNDFRRDEQGVLDRLVDGAILVFDDWTYRTDKGETKAFYPWAQRQTHLRFEFLFAFRVIAASRFGAPSTHEPR